ncbi:head GIN domain-containing protein [Devosia sp. SL43]|uniref:head GIN domain-containing protein n=1 Tax=Devosia sp. SL43 TaxID=2806348 RepID=UPI001F17F16E|nr:head GIN domain-containing protein [Devosia sp. SL43]UJW86596.1 DUF2807 domain-containing protein [Devosia sp. SL43]
MRRTAILALATTVAMTGTAFAQSRDFDLAGFDRIDIATGLDAVVTIGDSFSVRAESRSQDALDKLEVAVNGGVLSAKLDQNFFDFIINGGLVGLLLSDGQAVQFTITLPALAGVDAGSGADVDLLGFKGDTLELNASSGADISVTNAELANLAASASSGADIELSGQVETLEVEASSGSNIDAADLVAKSASADASSGADISVHATQDIKAAASSGGDIEVLGNPTSRDIDASSGGDVSFDD